MTSEDEVDEAATLEPRQDGGVFGGDTYGEWILTEGPKWKDPDPLGPKWLGGSVVRCKPSRRLITLTPSSAAFSP